MKTLTSPPSIGSRQAGAKQRLRIPRGLGLALSLLFGILLLAAFGAAWQVIASSMDVRKYPAPGQMLDVGGFRMHLSCSGEGSPTVILEPGSGSNSLTWFLVQPDLATSTRVCAYDRAGLGWSESGPNPRTGQRIAEELHMLLNAAGIPPPYVLAGWSYGGLFVRSYAVQYPEEVAGLVLLDASHPDMWTRTALGQSQYKNDSNIFIGMRLYARLGLVRLFPLPFTAPPASLPAEKIPQWRAVHNTTKFFDAMQAESRSILETMSQLREAGHLGDLPLLVVTAGENQGADGQWAVYQQELASLSTHSLQIIVEGAQHHELVFDPEYSRESSRAIQQMVETVRAGVAGRP